MARVHGKDADFSFDSVVMEGWLNSVTASFTVPQAEITSFTDAWQNVLAGKPTVDISVDGLWDSVAGGPDITIFGELGLDAEEWDFEPDGTTGYNGFATVVSYSITSSVADAVRFSAAFKHNGGAAEADGAAPTRA